MHLFAGDNSQDTWSSPKTSHAIEKSISCQSAPPCATLRSFSACQFVQPTNFIPCVQTISFTCRSCTSGETASKVPVLFQRWSQVLITVLKNLVISSVSFQTLFLEVITPWTPWWSWCLTSSLPQCRSKCVSSKLPYSIVEKILGWTPDHKEVYFSLFPVLSSRMLLHSHVPCQAVQALQEVNSQDTWSSPKTEPCQWENVSPARAHCVV